MAKDTRRRSAAQRARDRAREASMYLHGALQADIAEELGLSQATVSNDLRAIKDEWLASAEADVKGRIAQELAAIDDLQRTYWAAWVRSCEDAEVETTKAVGSPQSPQRMEKTKRVEGQAGDPRFLQGVERCIERRCKLLGLDAPERREISGSLGLRQLEEFTDDDLDEIANS